MSGFGTDPLVGRRFGSYVIELKLGEGGMGAVYRAVQPEIGKRVAVKFLAPDLATDPQVVQRFFAEARAVNLIQHENIVDIFDFREQDGLSYFVMELLTGQPLSMVLGDLGRMPLPRALAIAGQVAGAIAAAHALAIVHRDLKPDNIFLTTKGGYADFVKVLDFGIAKLTRTDGTSGPRTLRGVVMGTPGYMSPEQGTGGPVDARTDIYALGVLLYRMIGGRMPFLGDSFDEILQRQLGGRVQPLSTLAPMIPPSLDLLVTEMLSREPARRPQAMREVQERLSAIFALLAPSPSGPHPISGGWRSVPPTRLPSGARRTGRSGRRTWWIGGALALAGAAALAAAWIHREAPTEPPASMTAGAPLAPVVTHPAPTQALPRPGPSLAASAAPPSSGAFGVFIETRPPGAEVRAGGRLLGKTPAQLTLDREQTLRLWLRGYREEELQVDRGTEHAIVPLEREVKAERPAHHPTPPAATDGTGLGLND